MATSGTTTFAPEFVEIAEEAWERAGREMRSGYDLRTARRSMNFLMIEWQNRGTNMWTIDEGTVSLVAGTATYTLPADTVDLMEHVLRTDAGDASKQNDTRLARVNVTTYANIPNKLLSGRPNQIFIERLRDAPELTVWPVPDQTYTLVYWRMRRIEDAGNGAETADMTYRFLPALVAGLAYYIAMKDPELAPRLEMLKMAYEEAYKMAASEDREKAPLRLVPAGRR